METAQTEWSWYNYVGFLLLTLLSLSVNTATLMSIAWNETITDWYTRCFLSSILLAANLVVIIVLDKKARNVAASVAIGAATPFLIAVLVFALFVMQQG